MDELGNRLIKKHKQLTSFVCELFLLKIYVIVFIDTEKKSRIRNVKRSSLTKL